MRETWTFLPGAAIALAAAGITAVVLSEHHSSERLPCDGCGELFSPDDLAPGELDSHWCSRCRDDAGAPYDCVVEDDGEP